MDIRKITDSEARQRHGFEARLALPRGQSDQAALLGALNTLNALGLPLLSVGFIPPS